MDYIFVSPALQHALADVAILHEPRTAWASDHASVVANIDIQQEGTYRNLPHREISTAATGNEESGGGHIGGTIGPGGRPVGTEVALNGNLRARFDLAPGSLCDMTCGNNGQMFVQQFRPTYFTAEWAGRSQGSPHWGPRLLQDGSLGKRELDHRWKGDAAAGGVKYSDLPPSVAARLRSDITANHLAVPPQ